MPLGSVFPGAEAIQGSVHVGGPHATSHRRETSQMHGELARAFAKPRPSCGAWHRAELGAGCELACRGYGLGRDVGKMRWDRQGRQVAHDGVGFRRGRPEPV